MYAFRNKLKIFSVLVYSDTIFLVTLSTDTASSADFIFDRDEINPGGHYNPSSGIYTVPYDGIVPCAGDDGYIQ